MLSMRISVVEKHDASVEREFRQKFSLYLCDDSVFLRGRHGDLSSIFGSRTETSLLCGPFLLADY